MTMDDEDARRRVRVPFTPEARRQVEQGIGPGESPAAQGRTIYPRGADPGRAAFVEQRERRRFAERLADAQLAARLPEGRAEHLVARFPPLPVTGGLEVYAGEGREQLLAETYRAVMQRAPELVPTAEDLNAAAELGEESVVDLMLAEVDRDVRLLLDAAAGSLDSALLGAQQILDAVLMIADDGHAPGTRVRMLSGPTAGRVGTVVGALWGSIGAPVGYRVRDEVSGAAQGFVTADLVVLAGQETLGR